MKRTHKQLQQTFDDTVTRIHAHKYRNINGRCNYKETIRIIDDIQALRIMLKGAFISSVKANKAVFSRRGVFIWPEVR